MTTEFIFPDIAEILANEITAVIESGGGSMHVGTRVPNPRPPSFVVLRRVGGPRLNLVADNPTVTIEAWAPTEAIAQDLLQTIRALIYAMRGTVTGGHAIYKVAEFAGPAYLQDPVSDQPRFTCTMSIGVRGTEVPVSTP